MFLPAKVCGVGTSSPPDVLEAQRCEGIWPRCLEPVQKLGRTGCSIRGFVSDLCLSKLNGRFCFLPLTNEVSCRSGWPRGSALWLEGNQLLCAGFKLPQVLWNQANSMCILICLSPCLPACVWYRKLLVRRGLALGM